METYEHKYPIAEMFCCPQGEGKWAGQLQNFIRLAGCTVGKKFPKERYQMDITANHVTFPMLPIYTEMCTTYDGRTFECDTDYRSKEKLTAKEIIAKLNPDCKRVCLTGGEPMMHPLLQLIEELQKNNFEINIETSGTIELAKNFTKHEQHDDIWITCSPKFNVLDEMVTRADEIKMLIDEGWDIKKVPVSILSHPLVYIQPINFENALNNANVKRCLDLQLQYPNWRISIQLHKVLGCR